MSDIIDNKAQHRYELAVEGHLATEHYKLDGNVITFEHTDVPKELVARALARSWYKAHSTRSAPPD